MRQWRGRRRSGAPARSVGGRSAGKRRWLEEQDSVVLTGCEWLFVRCGDKDKVPTRPRLLMARLRPCLIQNPKVFKISRHI